MSADATSYTALYDPEKDALGYVPPLATVLDRAREVLEEKATANIHDHTEMLRAAVSLEMRLRQLVAALEAEGRA
ncbi:hypothetical protein J7F02_06010 [Streptomyces sp. ISL-112]|uniref:hypothetical protein n=1 Tax=unclassified Streptomyces TaxID=2593676 RepID=UPI001BEBA98D|nr:MULTISPECIES: hypothetical protein [unclassified Streptomyces]MBT2425252.1 hypothetical protein [Streptomyces sp. ISL-112]MBT2462043.1 hypothetical protein [Streptomyces sp. ISL-63]